MLNAYRMSQIMTPRPITVQADERLHQAERLMEKHRIRHLPVTVGDNEVVGMMSERDLHMAGYYRYPECLRVCDLMKELPYCVLMDSYAVEALRLMVDFKAEAIVVTTGRRTLQGIFTRHDALKLLSGIAESRTPLRLAA